MSMYTVDTETPHIGLWGRSSNKPAADTDAMQNQLKKIKVAVDQLANNMKTHDKESEIDRNHDRSEHKTLTETMQAIDNKLHTVKSKMHEQAQDQKDKLQEIIDFLRQRDKRNGNMTFRDFLLRFDHVSNELDHELRQLAYRLPNINTDEKHTLKQNRQSIEQRLGQIYENIERVRKQIREELLTREQIKQLEEAEKRKREEAEQRNQEKTERASWDSDQDPVEK